MDIDESTDPPTLNEETPPLDALVAVEWWHSFNDAERFVDDDLRTADDSVLA